MCLKGKILIMNDFKCQDSQKRVAAFEQYGEKSTAIASAKDFTINNYLTQSTDDENLAKTIEELQIYREKIKWYEELGIINCAEELKGTDLEPLKCMTSVVHRSLYFMGVGGEKWVKDSQLRKAFENMLRKVKAVNGEVRFLLINPASDAYNNLYQLRGESVPYDSYGFFIEFIKQFDNLKVHLYSHMPSFRMQFVDDNYLAVSRYYFDKTSHDKWGGGWKIPHLIICNEQQEFGKQEIKHKGSLFGSFLLAYNSIWQNGIDIKQWDVDGRNYNK